MRKSMGENIFFILFVLVGAAIFYGSWTMRVFGTQPFNGRDYGRLISALLVIVALGQIATNFVSISHGADKSDGAKVNFDNPVGLLIVFAISVFYCFGITKIGYFTSTFIFTFVMMAVLSEHRKAKHLIVYAVGALVFCVALYFLFQFMKVYMPYTPLI